MLWLLILIGSFVAFVVSIMLDANKVSTRIDTIRCWTLFVSVVVIAISFVQVVIHYNLGEILAVGVVIAIVLGFIAICVTVVFDEMGNGGY